MEQVDTSSYPRLPATPPNFLDTASKLQGLQSGAISNQQQQLALIQQRFKAVSGQIPGLLSKPDLNENDIRQFYQNNVKEGLITPDMAATEIGQIPPTQGMNSEQAALTLKNHLGNKLQMAQSTMEALNYQLGQQGSVDNGQSINPTIASPKPGFAGNPQAGGVVQPQAGIPIQLPPTQGTVSQGASGQPPRGTPGVFGSQPSQTGLPRAPGALPVGPAPVPSGMRLGGAKVTGIDVGPDTGSSMGGVPNAGTPKAVPTQSFTATGLPPGASTAMEASGQQLAQARLKSASFQRDIFPLVQAIPALEKLGTRGTGPGTETINHLKSFVLSNVPGVKESDFSGTVRDYDVAKKYLTDFVNQTGNSGTNDKLAAAFAGNPSTNISNAAAVDVAKSALALRRMEQAKQLTFEQSGLPEGEFSKWNAGFTNALDPRAFGVDLMDKPALQKMYKQIDKNPVESARFDKSLDIAHKLGFITPPSGNQ